jgi:hypothetical protein
LGAAFDAPVVPGAVPVVTPAVPLPEPPTPPLCAMAESGNSNKLAAMRKREARM